MHTRQKNQTSHIGCDNVECLVGAETDPRGAPASDGHVETDSQVTQLHPQQAGRGPASQSLTSAISNAVVRLYAEHIGRGPTKARTIMSRNLVTVVLEDTFTKGERALLLAGERDAVLTTRGAYQRTLRKPLTKAVEQLTGRTVIAVLSGHNDDPDVAVENFVLEPEPYEDMRSGSDRRDGRVSHEG